MKKPKYPFWTLRLSNVHHYILWSALATWIEIAQEHLHEAGSDVEVAELDEAERLFAILDKQREKRIERARGKEPT